MFYQFPENFSWGSAIWAQGTEGAWNLDGKAQTVFEKYYEMHPERFYNRQSPYETLDWYHCYPRYHDYISQLKHKSFRLSIQWARLLPDGKNVNLQAVEYYRNLLLDLKKRGIDVYVVLYWFDMPVIFEERGGFGSRDVIDDFVYYCHQCFNLFDDLVDIWHVYNEPQVDAGFKYLDNLCYPNIVDFRYHSQVIFNMVLAHARVVEIYKKCGFKKKIGSVIAISCVYPRSESNDDLLAARLCSQLEFKCFLDPLVSGKFSPDFFSMLKSVGASPVFTEADLLTIANNTMDVLGINYYAPTRVKQKETPHDPQKELSRDYFYDIYEMPDRIMNVSRGWEIYPRALYDTLIMIKNEYRNIECYISENGIGITQEEIFRKSNDEIEDDYRIDFLKNHLIWAHQAISEGVNLCGFHVWSFIDLWSPSNQFKNMYGLIEFNPQTKQTKLKKSARWYRQITLDNGFYS